MHDIVKSVSPSLQDVKESLNTTSALFSEVAKLLQLLYSVPASTASAESSLRRLKSYLRSTMTAQRLNHMLLLHVHNDLTDEINLCGFVRRNERRKRVCCNLCLSRCRLLCRENCVNVLLKIMSLLQSCVQLYLSIAFTIIILYVCPDCGVGGGI